jgi:SAM-dependent methyltransferase
MKGAMHDGIANWARRTVRLRDQPMPQNEVLERAARLVGYANAQRYSSRGTFLFQGIQLQAASVLEVGCGTGAWAIWTALNGAMKSIGIEPEGDGSTKGTFDTFQENIRSLGLGNRVEAYRCTLQNFGWCDGQLDVIVMYNMINHLDEDAVEVLHQSEQMAARYVDLLRVVRAKLKLGGCVVVADCARSNLWAQLGLRSPFDAAIEWDKHQNPSVWIRIFERAGFKNSNCRWSPIYPIGRLSTNVAAQYVTRSHFVLNFVAI